MPAYTSTYIFVNDYSAVKEDQPEYAPTAAEATADPSGFLLQAQGVKGRCYVITFSPSHNLTLADLPHDSLVSVIRTWTELYASHLPSSHRHYAPAELGVLPPKEQYDYLQIFENKGAAMGCSNPHPHGQAWCTTGLPSEVSTELVQMAAYRKKHDGRGLLADYVALEVSKGERIVFANSTWVALCPWWAVWPFEMMIVPKREVASLPALSGEERDGLAEVLSQVTKRYDNLFETQFPYSMGIHQAPINGEGEEDSHLHLHFYPPLLRSATVRKFLVGYVSSRVRVVPYDVANAMAVVTSSWPNPRGILLPSRRLRG